MADETKQIYDSREWHTGDVITANALNKIENEMEYVSAEVTNAVTGTINDQKLNDTIARKLDSIVKYFLEEPTEESLEHVRMYVQPAEDNGEIEVPTYEEFTSLSNSVIDLKSRSYLNGFIANGGTYTIPLSEIEQGGWSYSEKTGPTALNHSKRIRYRCLIPVTSGTTFTYVNPTLQIYIGRLASLGQSSYTETLVNWKAPQATGETVVSHGDGYVVIMMQDNNTTHGNITPSAYDCTITVTSDGRNDFDDLSNEVKNIILPRYNNNLVIPEQCSRNTVVSSNNGRDINYSGYFTTNYIPVIPGVVYKTNTTRSLQSAYYNSNYEFLSGGYYPVNGAFTPPSGAAYIRLSISVAEIETPYDLYIAPESDYFEKQITWSKTEFGYKIVDNIYSVISKILGLRCFPNNIAVPKDFVDHHYVLPGSGVVDDSISDLASHFMVTGYVPVTAETNYKMNYYLRTTYAYYNLNKVYTHGGYLAGDGTFAPEDGDAYIRISIDNDVIADPYGVYIAEESEYNGEIYIGGTRIDNDPVVLPWPNGKKIAWIGDSIIQDRDFDEYVCATMGMTELHPPTTRDPDDPYWDNYSQYHMDYGINGCTIAQGNASDPLAQSPICLRYVYLPDDADIVAVSAGTNDFASSAIELGAVTDDTPYTFNGALNILMSGLLNKYPGKVVFFTTPLKRAAEQSVSTRYKNQESQNVHGEILKQYRDAIIERGAYWGIPVLDLWGESLLNPTVESNKIYFTNSFEPGVYLHPTDAGREIAARRICGWLKQLADNVITP